MNKSSLLKISIAVLALVAICTSLILKFTNPEIATYPLLVALAIGGGVLVLELLGRLIKLNFGSDLLAGISIVTSVLLGEYMAGTIVVLMLSGGEALESYAVRRASRVLEALSKRMPNSAHKVSASGLTEISPAEIQINDHIVILPHEIVPVDGEVVEGHGGMDESYLTGEPYHISKAPGSSVISGALNGESAITIRATKLATDSRFAKIMRVMQESEQRRPEMRRLGDTLGAYYTPLALLIALLSWYFSGDPSRFLSVLVVATPCPLLIAIPVAIIGSISLAAERSIIVRDPRALEQVDSCSTMIFDKTGTLTFGHPQLSEIQCFAGFNEREVLTILSSIERYSKHPLAKAVITEATQRGIALYPPLNLSEKPGEGLSGVVKGREVKVTGRSKIAKQLAVQLKPRTTGLECVVLIDSQLAALVTFRDELRTDSSLFINHLSEKHSLDRLVLLSGDAATEVEHIAKALGITEVHSGKSPEEKVEIVREETKRAKTIFVGDGINDAPALIQATVGIAFGKNSEVTSEAGSVVILESSLRRVDEFLHIGQRMRNIALQSALGGMGLSVIGMILASFGFLTPIAGALIQELIDLFAVLNALRTTRKPKELSDY